MFILARKILIYAVSEGLILRSLPHKDRRTPSQTIKILFSNNFIELIPEDQVEKQEPVNSFEVFGIVGLLTVSKLSYLVTITRREQVAHIHGKQIYVVTAIALVPLSSKIEAESSIKDIQTQLLSQPDGSNDSESSDSANEDCKSKRFSSSSVSEEIDDVDQRNSSTVIGHKRTHSIAQDVITKKGGYGRFAQKWFSKAGWTLDQRRNLGMTSGEDDVDISRRDTVIAITSSNTGQNNCRSSEGNTRDEHKFGSITENMFRKLLRTTQLLLGSSRSFYFSYDFDITRNFKRQSSLCNELPLHKQVLTNYFWNRHLLKPFITAGYSSFCLPLMQGFIGQRKFKMELDLQGQRLNTEKQAKLSPKPYEKSPEHPPSMQKGKDKSNNQTSIGEGEKCYKHFLLTLISRRSVQRAGLRYLRRGVDEKGFTANFVETEQILSDPAWAPNRRMNSFVQIRGSIPLFWSQLPYSFKPTPRLQHTEEINLEGYLAHIKNLKSTYGEVQILSLVEKRGPEATVGAEYEKLVKTCNEGGNKIDLSEPVDFEWWDFHGNCRGMKFENVSLIIGLLSKKLQTYGYTTKIEGSQVVCQNGVIRTNCMDCLDRTNVTQSAFARKSLEWQLAAEGIDLALQADQETIWFNNLWADNGDAISKQYASTLALKGDYTRKRKRELAGALKDVTLSISRFYNGIFNDYFSQAAIDYLLGNATEFIFEDFDERFMTVDPAVSMQRIREQMIDLCQRQVISDNKEEFICGWTLLTPIVPNAMNYSPLQESVFLITDMGIYSCRVDWDLEKLLDFERIPFDFIRNIKRGTYITSTLSAAQIDESRNVGLAITYTSNDSQNSATMHSQSTEEDLLTRLERLGNRSISHIIPALTGPADATRYDTRVLTLKALPSRSSVVGAEECVMSEREQIMMICSEIERLINAHRIISNKSEEVLITYGDIISLDEARKRTGAFEKLSHNFKKLVWG